MPNKHKVTDTACYKFRRALEKESGGKKYEDILDDWSHVSYQYDEEPTEHCICGVAINHVYQLFNQSLNKTVHIGSTCLPHWAKDVKSKENIKIVKSIKKVCKDSWDMDTKFVYACFKQKLTKWEQDFYVNIKVNKNNGFKKTAKQKERLMIIKDKVDDAINTMSKKDRTKFINQAIDEGYVGIEVN
jgi:hypothetical protein